MCKTTKKVEVIFRYNSSAPIARKLIKYYLYGDREDSLPSILPNTAKYEKFRADKYQKKSSTPYAPKEKANPNASKEAILDGKRKG